jgi:hypothetical protein
MQEEHELQQASYAARKLRAAWRTVLSFTLLLACTLLAVASATASASSTVPQPFVATYAVTFRGLNGGKLRMQLRPGEQAGQYVFETTANPSTLASFFVNRNAVERSVLEATPDGPRPLSWLADDGKSGHEDDGKLQFDWKAQRVTGESEGKPVSLPTEPGMQDRMSMQVAVMASLQQGKEPGNIAMINDEHIRRYSYARTGTATMDTALGKIDTVIYESTRPGSNRLSRMWHAPSMGYLPVRMEQVRKGKVETVMTLVSVER